ncbi:zinc finger A20 and AN1 domain-containing stress-associated protein 8-like [Senna tora]|uniref:Zinc finger A20 and AN1 domain-containing stress-associated protein 8-like n=1 Tax=Senna tora TaxID=362788 RepID=A0A834SKK5_9FABA|nr:zinc finger A20 and AN1 domain-containing stress-associated protein 8-like [Senna tora]
MDHDKTGCQAPPEGPILCINNCGFFGSAATMNMCSKCHKDMMLKEEQAKLAASSIGNIMNGSSSSSGNEPVVSANVNIPVNSVEPKTISAQSFLASGSKESGEAKPKDGPKRCSSCNKRVGLTGFNCRCDKHDCPFDYRTAAQDAITKANPVVKAEKLDKI